VLNPRFCLLSLLAIAPALLLSEGDAHYARRAEGASGVVARPAEIDQALDSYRAALTAEPGSIGARWRLMRALYFRASYCGASREEAKPWREEAKRVGDEGVEGLEKALGEPRAAARIEALRGQPEAVSLYFWTAVSWGEWALARGTFAAARSGAAGRVRDLGQTVVLLDPSFQQGGGDRILGRLHDQSPHIVLVTGWVSRERAVQHLERALAHGPDNTVISGPGTGREKWKPWAIRQPEAARYSACSRRSTPSATTSQPTASASCRIAE